MNHDSLEAYIALNNKLILIKLCLNKHYLFQIVSKKLVRHNNYQSKSRLIIQANINF